MAELLRDNLEVPCRMPPQAQEYRAPAERSPICSAGCNVLVYIHCSGWRVPFQKGFISCYYQGGQEVWRKGVVRLLFPPADGGRMARGGVGQVKPVPLLIYLPGVGGGGALSGRVAASAWSVITRRRFALWPRKRGAQYSAPLS